jgi:hypothetical protein
VRFQALLPSKSLEYDGEQRINLLVSAALVLHPLELGSVPVRCTSRMPRMRIWTKGLQGACRAQVQRFVRALDLFASNFREECMTRTALIALAGGTAIILAAPAAAQSTGQQGVGQQPSAQPSAAPAANAAVPPVNGDDASPTPSEGKPNAKPKADSHRTCGTAVRAGPNAGQVIGKCRKDSNDDAPPKS